MKGIKVFFEAIQAGNQAAVADLLAQNPALLKTRGEKGISAVLTAAYYHEPAIADWLVSQGAPLDIFEACAVGAVGEVERLLDKYPELVNAVALDGFQPLGLAAFFGHADLVTLLLRRGSKPGSAAQNEMRVTPLHSAAAGRHTDIARLLLEGGAPVGAKSTGGFTPLHSAAQNGNEELVRLLLEHGADPHAASDAGKTPADLAREKGHAGVVKLLG